jgi:hypothetical protein
MRVSSWGFYTNRENFGFLKSRMKMALHKNNSRNDDKPGEFRVDERLGNDRTLRIYQ